MTDEVQDELIRAARVVSGAGLSDAFGHVCVRVSATELRITAAAPLAFQPAGAALPTLGVHATELPAGAPREAWIHTAIARSDPSTGAICRAQPRSVAKAIAAGRRLRALDGQGALLGAEVPLHLDSRLVRDAAAADAVVATLGAAPAVVLRGNGAVTRGPDLASAVALMWLLERSAELALHSPADARTLPADEQEWWRDRAAELLPRIYDFLVRTHATR